MSENRLYSKEDINYALNLAFTDMVNDDLLYLEGAVISDFVVKFNEFLDKILVRLRVVKSTEAKDGDDPSE